jgi:OmcA/MtrC family decaheme c-type cytochrome
VAGGAGGFDVTLAFSITKDGAPFIDVNGLPSLDSKSFYIVEYDSTTGEFPQQFGGFPSMDTSLIVSNGDGSYTLTQNFAVDPTALAGGAIVGSIKDGLLQFGDSECNPAAGKRICLYAETASASIAIGDIATFVSAANVEGCQACHSGFLADGTTKGPYRKHGNIDAVVAGVPDFVHCKGCHSADSAGGHPEWQYMVDRPLDWATGVALVPGQYDYTRTLMNDVHMSHAMEFPYPQSAQNCATCHAGKLDVVIADATFTPETCLSCHPVDGVDAWPREPYNQGTRAPALAYLWDRSGVAGFHPATRDAIVATDCNVCHSVGGVAEAQDGLFSDYHSGYDVNLTDENGVPYADQYSVAINSVSYDEVTGLITVEFSASDPAIQPLLYISFYGWDSKNFIAPAHERDSNALCTGFRPGCQMEYVPDSFTGEVDPNPIFTEDAASNPTDGYKVTADPSQWLLKNTDSIPDMIADGTIRRFEVSVGPTLNLSNLTPAGPDRNVWLLAVNETFDLNAGAVVDNYFKGTDATVSIDKCNFCHGALGSPFHSERGRAGDGIEVCKNCHNPTYAGSHLEMASRSIDSYVHAIHSMQAFDVGDIFTGEDANDNPIPRFDPVDAKRYDMHIGHVFPTFTITNCEGCHVTAGAANGAGGTFPVVYNVPDQSKSMPGLLSGSDLVLTWYDIVGEAAVENTAGRNIGTVPTYVTGVASRACGGCHRADLINADLAGDLAAWNAHTEAFGTLADATNDPETPDVDETNGILYGVIDKIMGLFN